MNATQLIDHVQQHASAMFMPHHEGAAGQLTFLEQTWSSYMKAYPEWLVITLTSFLLHEAVYFGRYVPFFICDFIPSLRQYKIQQGVENTRAMNWRCLKLLAWNHGAIQLPMMLLFHPVAEAMGMKIAAVPFPTWYGLPAHRSYVAANTDVRTILMNGR